MTCHSTRAPFGSIGTTTVHKIPAAFVLSPYEEGSRSSCDTDNCKLHLCGGVCGGLGGGWVCVCVCVFMWLDQGNESDVFPLIITNGMLHL